MNSSENTMSVLVAAGMVALLGATAHAQESVAGAMEGLPRAEAVRLTLAGMEKQLADHGGTWEKWVESVKPYRDDIRGIFSNKWPWAAKKDYVFQGAAVSIQLRDNFDDLPDEERPLDSIVHFDRQLKALGIDLIVALVPAKLSVYPDYINAAVPGEARLARAPEDRIVSIAVLKLMYDLLKKDVEVVNLHEDFRQFRLKNGDDVPLFYVRDAHYMNRGARLSAQKIGDRLKRYDFVKKALEGGNRYVAEKGSRSDGDKADSDLLIIKEKNGQLYSDSADSPVILLGDSHFGYNPRGAHFSAQVACQIGMPVAQNWKEGLSSTIPVEVAKDPNLKKRRVVIMHYTERMLRPKAGQTKWPIVNLPGAEGTATPAATTPAAVKTAAAETIASGVVSEVSPPPERGAAYPHYLMKFYMTKLADKDGKQIGSGDGVVHVLAMHNRKILPVATTKKDVTLTLKLTPWSAIDKRYNKLQAGTLPTVELEIEKTAYWGEIEGQRLTEEEMARIGQDDRTGGTPAETRNP
jgi:hypothetical protein